MQDYTTLIIALLLSFIGILAIAWLMGAMFLPLLKDTRGFTERVRFRQREKTLEAVDALIEKNDFTEAFKLLLLSFFFDAVRADKELIEKIHNHHVGILSRIVLVAEKLSRHVENLAIIEDLVLSRSELLRSLFEVRQSRTTLSSRRSKETPQWALDEYTKKIDELLDRLKTNQRSLESQMALAISETKSPQQEQEITFH